MTAIRTAHDASGASNRGMLVFISRESTRRLAGTLTMHAPAIFPSGTPMGPRKCNNTMAETTETTPSVSVWMPMRRSYPRQKTEPESVRFQWRSNSDAISSAVSKVPAYRSLPTHQLTKLRFSSRTQLTIAPVINSMPWLRAVNAWRVRSRLSAKRMWLRPGKASSISICG